jgi:hypothetical protein
MVEEKNQDSADRRLSEGMCYSNVKSHQDLFLVDGDWWMMDA